MAGVVTCSIVLAERWPDANLTHIVTHQDAPEARGLISVSEESWPQATGAPALRAVITVEATNPDSIRWYARQVLDLAPDHPAWQDMERQLAPNDLGAPLRVAR
jgi:hypothetical protein